MILLGYDERREEVTSSIELVHVVFIWLHVRREKLRLGRKTVVFVAAG